MFASSSSFFRDLRRRSTDSLAADSAARDAREIKIDLEERLDKLTITCMAMWTLIQEQTSLTEEDLLERVKQIDLMDGTADGKVTRQIAKCHACDRVMSPRHTRCLYCGEEKLILSAFDTIT